MLLYRAIGGLIATLFLFAVVGCESGSGPKSTGAAKSKEAGSGKPVASLDSGTLWQEYGANELKADSLYKGKLVKVTGTVASDAAVQRDQSGKYYVALSVAASFQTGGVPGVICYITDDSTKQFTEVEAEQDIEM